MGTRILVAPNAFKGSTCARTAARAISAGLKRWPLTYETVDHPVGDGGDGTGRLLCAHYGAVRLTTGGRAGAEIGLVQSRRLAILDSADFIGIGGMPKHRLNPLASTSAPLGRAVRQALDQGARSFWIGLGGTATVDAGVGFLRALGVRFLDGSGLDLPNRADALVQLASLDVTGLDRRLNDTRITLLCDVENPLIGANGAARVFGPQKGADQPAVKLLEEGHARLIALIGSQTGFDISALPRGGAAGGIAASLHALLGAKLVSGIEHFLDATDFDAKLAATSLVITGEGEIDEQTLLGKAPYGVAIRARKFGKAVVALAGRVPLSFRPEMRATFDVMLSIGDRPRTVEAAVTVTAQNLERLGYEIGSLLGIKVAT